eukprot:2871427-Rhodomonas_salina.2
MVLLGEGIRDRNLDIEARCILCQRIATSVRTQEGNERWQRYKHWPQTARTQRLRCGKPGRVSHPGD